MNADGSDRAQVRIRGENRMFEVTRPPAGDRAIEELKVHRRRAQAEAYFAYEAWSRAPKGDVSYASYRAAQDRADAAQDQLASAHRSKGDTAAAAAA